MSSLLKIWLAYGAFSALAGWILSAVHELNRNGYIVVGALTICAVLVLHGRSVLLFLKKLSRPRFRLSRFRRPLPLIYIVLLFGCALGGVIYAPNNYDMLTYRIPRILNWLAEGRWHWIDGYIDRMNYSGTSWEWMALPLLLLTGSTAFLFLINLISYIFLPGLVFEFLRGLGVGRRMAWSWMWLVPSGLNFVLQAGSGANDTVSVVYMLSALVFAFRARRSGKPEDVFWSFIAIALMTSCKASNLPLVLPWLFAIAPALAVLKRALPSTVMIIAVSAAISLLPTLLLNYQFTRDWSGSPGDPGHLKIHNPLAGLLGNTLQIGIINLQPPVMPFAGKWNALSQKILPSPIESFLRQGFPRFSLRTSELPQEEEAGLGIGLTVLGLISLIVTAKGFLAKPTTEQNPWRPNVNRSRWHFLILIAGAIAVLTFMAALGSESAARLAAPYYLFIITPLLLHANNNRIVRHRWWQTSALLASMTAVPSLILTPSRPLFPAERLLNAISTKDPGNNLLHRAALVYTVYARRADNLAPLRRYLGAGDNPIGIVGTSDTSETSLWEPFGSHRVIEITPYESPLKVRALGIRFIVLESDGLRQEQSSIQKFLSRFGGTVIGQEQIIVKVAESSEDWYVLDLGEYPPQVSANHAPAAESLDRQVP